MAHCWQSCVSTGTCSEQVRLHIYNNFIGYLLRTVNGSVCLPKGRVQGAQWLSGRVLDSRPRGRGSSLTGVTALWSRHIYPSLVLVQPRKTRPCLTERLLMERKESNQTNKTPRSGLPSSGRATLPMQTDVWMFWAQTMKMGRGASTPCIRTDLWETLPAKSDGLWESKQPHARTLFGAATCPVHNDVMNVYKHLDVSIPKNEDGRGSFDPMHQNRPWGDAPPQNQTACGKANSHMQGLCLGQRHAQCRKKVVMKASCIMQTVVEAVHGLEWALQRQVDNGIRSQVE